MPSDSFNPSDLQQIQQRGLTPEAVSHQLELFRGGTPFAKLTRPATMGDGIISIEPKQVARLTAKFDTAQQDGRIQKFVPASGAATRMFKSLYEATAQSKDSQEETSQEVSHFFSRLPDFAFFQPLKEGLEKNGIVLKGEPSSWPRRAILEYLLEPPGLGYGHKPKGLLHFHIGPEGPRTAMAEHIEEALAYGLDRQGHTRLHFTVSPEHQSGFEALVDQTNAQLKNEGKAIDVTFSVQKPSTDTIAANPDCSPFRDAQGSLVFRPGGHGALIENLNDLEGDLVILKNIDNVVPPSRLGSTIQYKKLLGGLLLDIQHRIFSYLDILESGQLPPRKEIFRFLETQLGIKPSPDQRFPDRELRHYLMRILNRPIRVCGMVRNQGEPGGGPFWVQSPHGGEQLQIVETSQVNLSHRDQKAVLSLATHFNPVDLVCGVRNSDGEPYSLLDFVDQGSYFIATKSQAGKPLLALERPGLWNGAMANWNTVFVEVPLGTFNPVKTVNDLLRAEHLPLDHE